MAARAKFKVEKITKDVQGGTAVKIVTANLVAVAQTSADEAIEIEPAGGAGQFNVKVTNPDVATVLQEGKEYRITFEEIVP